MCKRLLRVIRRRVFETNSSSTHSLSIVGASHMVSPSYGPREIVVSPGEYGWGYERLYDPLSKLSYIVTAIQYYDQDIYTQIRSDNEDAAAINASRYFKWLSEMTEEYTGWTLTYKKSKKDWYPHGYIDHQSVDLLDDYFIDNETEFKSNMRDIIFNDKYQIITDNDNH